MFKPSLSLHECVSGDYTKRPALWPILRGVDSGKLDGTEWRHLRYNRSHGETIFPDICPFHPTTTPSQREHSCIYT